MKRLIIFITVIIISTLIGGLYGIVHDQITYTVSEEYYTKFKFYQFGLMDVGTEAIFQNPRIQVSIVGFMATWWMGLIIGLIIALMGITIKDTKKILSISLKAFLLTVIVALITGLLGLLYGKLILANKGVDWWLPDNLVDKKNFIAVGSMHNFSYLGGLTGLLISIIYILKPRRNSSV